MWISKKRYNELTKQQNYNNNFNRLKFTQTTFDNDCLINRVKEVNAYKCECECDFINDLNNLREICPECGKELFAFRLK